MNISFLGVLFRPLKINNGFKLVANLTLAFLPALLAWYTLGVHTILFKIMLGTGLLIAYGYLFTIFQEELENEEKNEEMPDWKFINNFFTGIKGLIFSALILALFVTSVLTLKLIVHHLPVAATVSQVIMGIGALYCIFAFYPASMGLFVQHYNPIVALKVSLVSQIVKECWLEYIVAFIYMILYLAIIGFLYNSIASFFGHSAILMGIFIIYTLMVYSTLYSKIYKHVRNEFENYI